MERTQERAEFWRAGENAALYPKPELAGAIDLFAAVRQRDVPLAMLLPPELVALHREPAERIEAGIPPKVEDSRPPATLARNQPAKPLPHRLIVRLLMQIAASARCSTI